MVEISTDDELWSLMDRVSTEAEAAVVRDAHARTWLLYENARGEGLAVSYPVEGYPSLPVLVERLDKPLTVLFDPGAETPLPLFQRVLNERWSHPARGWDAEHDIAEGVEHLHALAEGYMARGDDAGVIKAASLLLAAIDLRVHGYAPPLGDS